MEVAGAARLAVPAWDSSKRRVGIGKDSRAGVRGPVRLTPPFALAQLLGIWLAPHKAAGLALIVVAAGKQPPAAGGDADLRDPSVIGVCGRRRMDEIGRAHV